MAGIKKPLFMDPTEGYHEEMAGDDELDIGKLTLSGVLGVAIDAGAQLISNVADPVSDQDAATKSYVDAVAAGQDPKDACRVLADTDTTLSGAGGTVDGVSVAIGNRVLCTNQTVPSQNGIWEVAAGAWTRPVDFAVGDSAASAFTFIQEGSTYSDTGWLCTNNVGSDTIDTDDLDWTQTTGAGTIVAGDGLDKTGNLLSVNDGDGITINSDNVTVDLAANPGLQFVGVTPAGQLAVLADTNRGLDIDGSGLFVDLAPNPALQFTSGDLDLLLAPGFGLTKDAAGLKILIDDSPDTLDVDGSGLKVVGLPSTFKINDVATSAGVTAANLDDLTDGSNADALHTHAGLGASNRIEDEMTANETVAAGDPVAWSATNNEFAKGDADNNPDSRVFGVAEDAVIAAATGTVVRRGPALGILAGATPNTPYYLQSGGGVGTTIPAGNKRVIRCGFAINATDLEVMIHDFGKKAA